MRRILAALTLATAALAAEPADAQPFCVQLLVVIPNVRVIVTTTCNLQGATTCIGDDETSVNPPLRVAFLLCVEDLV